MTKNPEGEVRDLEQGHLLDEAPPPLQRKTTETTATMSLSSRSVSWTDDILTGENNSTECDDDAAALSSGRPGNGRLDGDVKSVVGATRGLTNANTVFTSHQEDFSQVRAHEKGASHVLLSNLPVALPPPLRPVSSSVVSAPIGVSSLNTKPKSSVIDADGNEVLRPLTEVPFPQRSESNSMETKGEFVRSAIPKSPVAIQELPLTRSEVDVSRRVRNRNESRNSSGTHMIVDVDSFIDEEGTKSPAPPARLPNILERDVNAAVPSVIAVRSASQHAAVNAIVGEEKHKARSYSADLTAELTDDELAAAITPDLHRHRGVTHRSIPGAFHAGGADSGDLLLQPPPPVLSRAASTGSSYDIRGEGGGGGGGDSVGDSCTTLVSATLVIADEDGSRAGRRGRPVLAHAEPMWKRRRVVVCLSVWSLLAVAVFTVSVFFALSFSGAIKRWKTFANPDAPVPLQAGPATTTISATTSPTSSPSMIQSEGAPSSDTITASHALSWGKISTCDDLDFFVEYDMTIRCGGNLSFRRSENADCRAINLEGTNVEDSTRMSCKLKAPDAAKYLVNGTYYQESLAKAIFTCSGTSFQDLAATVILSTMQISNCTGAMIGAGGQHGRNLAPPQTSHARAVQQAVSTGSASAFVALGRLCHDSASNHTSWALGQGLSACETGKRLVITGDGEVYDDAKLEKLFYWLESPAGSDAAPKNPLLGGIFSFLTGLIKGSSGSDHQSFNISDYSSLWQMLGLDVFCFDVAACHACSGNSSNVCSGRGRNCTYEIPSVRMSDSADRGAPCFKSLDDASTVESMWDAAADFLSPSVFIDYVIEAL